MNAEPKMMTILDPDTGEVVGEFLMHKGRRMTVDGAELPDPTPIAPPVGFKKAPSMFDHLREQMAAARKLAEMEGLETPEEADDFDVEDDPELKTQYEIYELSPEQMHEELGNRSPLLKGDESAEGAEPKEPKAPSPSKKKPAKKAPDPSEEDSEDD